MLNNLKYRKHHEWIKVGGNTSYLGITHFAQSELSYIVYIKVETVG